MWRLTVDAVTLEVMRLLHGAGIEALLLKEPSIADWLYDDPAERGYVDTDVLVRPSQLARSEELLCQAGFEREWGPLEHAGMEAPHAHPWRRGALSVDLHWRLPEVGAEPAEVFSRLLAGSVEHDVSGRPVPVMAEPARLAGVVLHVAHHGPDHAGPVRDLKRALMTCDLRLWGAAAEWAREIDAEGAFAAGLRTVSEGEELLAGLGVDASPSLAWKLRNEGPPLAEGIDRLVTTPGLVARLRLVADEVFPSLAFMRWWSPLARRSRRGLAAAYVWRWLFLARATPRAVLAWLHASRRG